MSPTHLTIIGRAFIWKSVIWYTAVVHYPEFGDCLLFGNRKCTASTGIAVGTSTVVHYTEDVHYWDGLLMEVSLYFLNFCLCTRDVNLILNIFSTK